MITNVTVGRLYIDPGATATKVPVNNPNNPLNLTASIIVSGLSQIKTAAPTLPSQPYVITYDVQVWITGVDNWCTSILIDLECCKPSPLFPPFFCAFFTGGGLKGLLC